MWNVGVFSELMWYVSDVLCVIGGVCVDYVSVCDKCVMKCGMMMSKLNLMFDDDWMKVLLSGFVCYECDFVLLFVMWYVGIGYVECYLDYWELFFVMCGLIGLVNVFLVVWLEKIM